MTRTRSDVSVVICAYTEERWHDLVAAVDSVSQQSTPAREIILVIDHNPRLLERACAGIPEVRVIASNGPRGLSGARNTGIAAAQGALIAFLDDDARASPEWLERLSGWCQDPAVLGAGGFVEPIWQASRPRWFPEEFYWVIGCSYRGLPSTAAQVRNPFGGCMCISREVFDKVGGFDDGLGRLGTLPAGCEETELCIRARQRWPDRVFVYDPRAKVHHRVPENRGQWAYFRSRCYMEGVSKARVARMVGRREGLSAERRYALRTLPGGVLRNLSRAALRRDRGGLLRAAAIIAGLAFVTAGYSVGAIRA